MVQEKCNYALLNTFFLRGLLHYIYSCGIREGLCNMFPVNT